MKTRVLLTGKDTSRTEAIANMAAESGRPVTLCATGAEVLSTLDSGTDGGDFIVLCDLHPADMTGLDLVERIRSTRANARTVVAVGPDEIEQGVKALQLDASDFMVEPITRDALDVCLKRADQRLRTDGCEASAQLPAPFDAPQLTFQQLFDEVPCYISVQDRNLRITRANRRFKEDFGDEIGGHCYHIYKYRTTPCPNCPVENTFFDGKPHQTEEIVTTKSGEQHNVLIWTAPIRDDSGEITHVMEIATDITQIRELQDHLTNLGLMIGSISHGIKGMLTALDGGMYKLESGVKRKDYDKIEEGADLIKLMANRVRNTVLDILFYAKERDLNWENVNVVEFADEIAAVVDAKAKNEDIRLVRDIDSSLGVFDIDPSVVSCALVNILENAIEACRDDDPEKDHEILFSVSRQNGHVIFKVCDNGPGMDRETLGKMFSLFFSSKGSKGTGLGLFIANDVIEQHGGKIEVESELGEGTCFTILLPATCRWHHNKASDLACLSSGPIS
ncbi:hybrid sensor histidine kinase/response regulator [Desulfovibrio oxyclinae]|uniref:hybrid sensor histidine kinase/response regulator n=1 Tax=Desulfovibrio oxyclinae TaxID=63560 RepID=UPI0003649667|nr:ATP-binding protein [Desulfovibrio oxyclinae]